MPGLTSNINLRTTVDSESKCRSGFVWVFWLQFVFLITGIASTVLTNLVSYHGGANKATLLPCLVSYLAMAMVYFLPKSAPKTAPKAAINHRFVNRFTHSKRRRFHSTENHSGVASNYSSGSESDDRSSIIDAPTSMIDVTTTTTPSISPPPLLHSHTQIVSNSADIATTTTTTTAAAAVYKHRKSTIPTTTASLSMSSSPIKSKTIKSHSHSQRGSIGKLNSPPKTKSRFSIEAKIRFIAIYDLLCTIVSFIALVTAGSGMYQLVYSSIIILSATLRSILLPGKTLDFNQWIACFIVTIGLLVSAMGQSHHFVSPSAPPPVLSNLDIDHSSINRLFGMIGGLMSPTLILPLLATALYAYEYVLVEKLLAHENAPPATDICVEVGMNGTCCMSGYVILKVLPFWNDLVNQEILRFNGDWRVVMLAYAAIFLACFGHNWAYFQLLGLSGAVSTGINQALRSVFVFVISALCFCQLQESQCFNSYKLLSLIIVCCGVLRYAYVTATKDESSSTTSTHSTAHLLKTMRMESIKVL